MSVVASPRTWPESLARVPYWVYQLSLIHI